jgi:hypothetical protein
MWTLLAGTRKASALAKVGNGELSAKLAMEQIKPQMDTLPKQDLAATK